MARIRRSGAKAVKLDRARWFADRERMFRKPMVVRANDVEVTRSDQGDHELVARFVQASHPTGSWLAKFTTKCNSDGVAQSHCLLPTPSRNAALVIHSRTMTV